MTLSGHFLIAFLFNIFGRFSCLQKKSVEDIQEWFFKETLRCFISFKSRKFWRKVNFKKCCWMAKFYPKTLLCKLKFSNFFLFVLPMSAATNHKTMNKTRINFPYPAYILPRWRQCICEKRSWCSSGFAIPAQQCWKCTFPTSSLTRTTLHSWSNGSPTSGECRRRLIWWKDCK